MADISPDSERNRLISVHERMAERAAGELEDALRLADLPPLVSLSPSNATGHVIGGHVQIGGANAQTVIAIAQFIRAHAVCIGRVVATGAGEDDEARVIPGLVVRALP
ncbi:hypothetical protein [Kitasatospora sp. NPDC050543]|uniref:hypothetical protein n=1 Tax=Kitasatospora sp. NPDC050543 TaxID=3364054 RepID=UPI003790E4FD